MRQDYNI